jgi:hypothetical protein
MKFLFLFLDGVGLGPNDPNNNPFVLAKMPVMQNLLGGYPLVAENAPFVGSRASLIGIDACLGIDGLPQSATGQATLLTGENVPKTIGKHYGPKPNRPVSEFLLNGNLFNTLRQEGQRVTFLNAYPPGYFETIDSGRRMYSAIPLAATSAGINLKNYGDLVNGRAISADFTAQGWREHIGLTETPVLSPSKAGINLANLSQAHNFAFFEYWLSDYAGHRQDMTSSCALLETLDQVLGGLLSAWDDSQGLILITSDHGNMEDLSTRRHTYNVVPALVIGDLALRNQFTEGLMDLTDIAPAITQLILQ